VLAARRLRDKSLIEEDFREGVIAPACHEEFVPDTDFGGEFIFQEAQRGPAQNTEIGVRVTFAKAATVHQ